DGIRDFHVTGVQTCALPIYVLGAFTVAGFSALESVSARPCNPLSVNRCGINLGEAAALFLMTRGSDGPVRLAAWGESSDAHHMRSEERREGKGCWSRR